MTVPRIIWKRMYIHTDPLNQKLSEWDLGIYTLINLQAILLRRKIWKSQAIPS